MLNFRKQTYRELWLSIGFLICIVIFQFIDYHTQKNFQKGFGAEYSNVAQSIVAGKGYANPFSIDSGPTAWTLPILTYLIALGFYLFSSAPHAFIFLSVIKFLAYFLSFYMVLKTIKISGLKVNHTLFLVIFLFYFLFSPSEQFRRINDLWISVFAVSFFLYALLHFLHENSSKYLILLVIACFTGPLINPGFALGFISIIFLLILIKIIQKNEKIGNVINRTWLQFLNFYPNKSANTIIWKLTLPLVAFMLAVSIWSVRNYAVFHKFIPLKSNMWFEFYLSNVVDSDGQLSVSTIYRAHPFLNEEKNLEISSMGEINWIDKYQGLSKSYLNNHLTEYLQKTIHRLFNAYIFIGSDKDDIPSQKNGSFTESDLTQLTGANLISFYDQSWICLFMDEREINKALNKLPLENKDDILQDWTLAKSELNMLNFRPSYFTRTIFMSLIPTLLLVLLMMKKNSNRNSLIISVLILYIIYLVPYILISHQMRYQRPLFILQIIILYTAGNLLFKEIRPYLTRIQLFNSNKAEKSKEEINFVNNN